ncbi:MAG TPA: calcium-binding protein [Stellaceae bacterium]|nr:calcium-binding protein [Stellaceae bacterium]
MATIPGSQFTATAPGQPVNVVETTTGTGLPPTVPGAFNLEVFVGDPNNAPPIDPGYQGLAVLSPNGHTIDLIQGSFAITDDGDTITAHGAHETISGGASFVNLILDGTQEAASGGGPAGDNIIVNGSTDTVNGGSGPEDIEVHGTGNTINAGSGADTINVYTDGNTVTGGSGPDTINAFGNNEAVIGGSGPDVINLFGAGGSATAGSGNDTVNVFAAGDTITGGAGKGVLGAYADNVQVFGGAGPSTVITTGTGDTVTAGNGNITLYASTNTNATFVDNGAALYDDTVVGFSNGGNDTVKLAAGDTIATSTVSNGNTQVVLSDGSKILLVGVTDIAGLFHH